MKVVTIIRAGDAMLESFLSIVPHAAVGKILIQRDESTAQPILFYSKLPNLKNKKVVIVDPLLGTGGSVMCAIKVLLDKGADINNVYFFNVLSCPEGIAAVLAAFPQVRIVTGCIDDRLNEKFYIEPGLGDFGDRFFGNV